MLTKQFKIQSSVAFSNSFINNIEHWKHASSSIHLAVCDFNLEQYRPELFTELGVFFPDEIKRAVYKRQAEFLAGRFAAKQVLLTAFQQDIAPTIHFNEHRSPKWPKGFMGSIAHTASKALCAMSRSGDVQYLGVDIESILTEKTAVDISPQIHTNAELSLMLLAGLSPKVATTLIFSAKESLFKAIYPCIGEYFGFECAEVISIDSTGLTLSLTNKFPFPAPHSGIYYCQFEIQEHRVITLLAG